MPEPRGAGCRGSRLIRIHANGSSAFEQYRDGGQTPWALIVLELDGDQIASSTFFMDTTMLFPRFGMPMQL
jgi:RNA polymerase sigma-70 factor, ECF subfamily